MSKDLSLYGTHNYHFRKTFNVATYHTSNTEPTDEDLYCSNKISSNKVVPIGVAPNKESLMRINSKEMVQCTNY